LLSKGSNKVDTRLEGVNIEEHDGKIEEETMRLVEILNEDDGKVPISVLTSVTLVFLGCCTLILTPFIIRQFENLCYESTFHANTTEPLAFAYGKAGVEKTYQEAQTYCETCAGFEAGGSCDGVISGATGRLVDMSNEADVNAVNELIIEVMRPLYDETFWVAPNATGHHNYIQIPDATKFDYNVIVKGTTGDSAHQVICVYEGMTCEEENKQKGPSRILVQ
jgi:hypothetical protein